MTYTSPDGICPRLGPQEVLRKIHPFLPLTLAQVLLELRNICPQASAALFLVFVGKCASWIAVGVNGILTLYCIERRFIQAR